MRLVPEAAPGARHPSASAPSASRLAKFDVREAGFVRLG